MIKAYKILAIDPASYKLGWAIGHTRQDIKYGTHVFPKAGSDAEKLTRVKHWINDMIDQHNPDVIAYEAANPGLKGKARYFITVIDGLISVSACIHEKKCLKYYPSEVKKHVTGNGRASKDDVITAITELGFIPEDDNAADALGIFLLAKTNVDNEKEMT